MVINNVAQVPTFKIAPNTTTVVIENSSNTKFANPLHKIGLYRTECVNHSNASICTDRGYKIMIQVVLPFFKTFFNIEKHPINVTLVLGADVVRH